MGKMALWVFAVVALSTAAISCKRIENVQWGLVSVGELKVEDAEFRDAIPAEYGKLIAVTNDVKNPAFSFLWFEKPDGTVVALGVNSYVGVLWRKVLVIPRK